jgi:hypothetical protein
MTKKILDGEWFKGFELILGLKEVLKLFIDFQDIFFIF